jgi:RNA polymerase sigma-70 factor (ECF subfamily)
VDTRSDSELLHDADRNDSNSFRLLFERHHGPVFRFAYRFSGSADTAEDITQDVFLSLLNKPSRFDSRKGELRTWLFGIARNLALKHFRRENPRVPLDEHTDIPGVPADLIDRIISDDVSRAVQRAVAALPPLQREVLILIEYEDLSLAQTAAIVSADVSAVKSRLHRARERLKVLLGHVHHNVSSARSSAHE